MKKRLLLFSVIILTFILTMIPVMNISADPGNLFKNGDFSDGLNSWETLGDVNVTNGEAILDGTVSPNIANISQYIVTSNKSAILNFYIKPTAYASVNTTVGINIWKDNSNIGSAWNYYHNLTLDSWEKVSIRLSDDWDYQGWAGDIPDFDKIWIFAEAAYGNIAFFDNFYIEGPDQEPEPWVRTMPMTCWRVWINEEGNFQFVFWYPYRDENFVRIYDMEGNMVYEVDMPVHDPNLIVDLPDGMYTVKTFHGLVPLQEFIIGKP